MAEYFENMFARAAAGGNTRILKQMLKKGVDVNKWDSDCRTALILALDNDHDEVVRLLVEAGVDVNKCDSDGKTPLSLAIENGRDETVHLLIEAGVNVNIYDSDGNTPLILALENAHDEAVPVSTETDDLTRAVQTCKPGVVNLLIQAGADVNRCYYRTDSPLYCAVRYNCVQCVSLLIEAGAKVNSRDVQIDLLCLASEKGHDQCLNLLIQAMGDDAMQHSSPLRYATLRGHVKCLSLLINAGVNVNMGNVYGTPLSFAVKNDHAACVSQLIKAGADVNHFSVRNHFSDRNAGGLEVTRLLLRSGLQINRLGWNIFAVKKPVVKLLLAAGAGGRCLAVHDFLPKADDLTEMCRDVIRKHLLNLDPHTHLFGRVERLGLPAALTRYLVFDQSLDDDMKVDNDEAEA